MSAALQSRKILVVGRGSGIARAIALAARAEGADVFVASRDQSALTAAYDGLDVTVARVDLTDESSVQSLAEQVGPVDHVVSTASARARGKLADLQPDAIAASFSTKVIGPILLAKHFAPTMPQDGSFVLFSGSSALKPGIGKLAVSVTNGAVDVLTRALAVELAPIRVNAISPGTIETGAYDDLGPARKAELFSGLVERNPARRIGQPEDVAQAVIFAITNTFLTGISLAVDGGEPLV